MSRNLKTWTECEIHPSAYEIADVFWAMDAEEQAGFFNRLAEIADRLPFQLQSVTDSPHLTPAGRAVMCEIGEYGESAQPAPGAWQPIETAARPFPGEPGFGVRLLVVVDCGEGTLSHVRVCWWQGDRWSFDSHQGSIESLGYRATHWQPLPAPPPPPASHQATGDTE